MVVELYKRRFNQGQDSRLCFFRDHTGNEVDVLYPNGPDYIPIEIKSGQTIKSDWFNAFAHFASLQGEASKSGIIVYAGDDFQTRSQGITCNPWKLEDVLIAWPPKVEPPSAGNAHQS